MAEELWVQIPVICSEHNLCLFILTGDPRSLCGIKSVTRWLHFHAPEMGFRSYLVKHNPGEKYCGMCGVYWVQRS